MLKLTACELLIVMICAGGAVAREAAVREQAFDNDPQWEGFNNRTTRQDFPKITQEFGFSQTNFAGKEPGEIGGQVWRSSTPMIYSTPIDSTSLDKPLIASGSLAVTETSGGSGAMLGFFNHDFTAGQRPTNSIMFHFGCERNGVRVHVRAISAQNSATGSPMLPPGGQHKEFLFAAGSTKHTWSLQYDPKAGRVTARIDQFDPVTIDLSPDVRAGGITVDRFGIINEQKSGRPMKLFLDDLQIDGQMFDFAKDDPKWQGTGNRASFEDRELAHDQDFGFSQTNNAGGQRAGEIGGTIWRTGNTTSWYADRVGALNLGQPLTASGRIALKVGAPDLGVYLGWFNSSAKDLDRKELQNFIGVRIEGPTRVGHYFQPVYAASNGERRGKGSESTPVLVPDGKSHAFEIRCDGKDQLTAMLDGKSTSIHIKPEDLKAGAMFDRFGLLTIRAGGQQVKLFLDDLTYTAGQDK